jgi:hypothetical protein
VFCGVFTLALSFCYMIARRYFWVLFFLRVTGGGIGSARAVFLASGAECNKSFKRSGCFFAVISYLLVLRLN